VHFTHADANVYLFRLKDISLLLRQAFKFVTNISECIAFCLIHIKLKTVIEKVREYLGRKVMNWIN